VISRPKKILLFPFVILVGLATGFLFAEIILRIWTPDWLSKEINETNLARSAQAFGADAGWSVDKVDGKFMRFKPSTQFRVHYYEYDNVVHIDPSGDRVVAEGKAKEKDAPFIPVLGDSFPFGVGVRDEETFVSLLNTRSRYRYMNLAVPGS